MENIITCNNQIEGFSLIKIKDQEHINKLILEIKRISEKIISKTNKIKNKTDKNLINITTKNKTESLKKSSIKIMYSNADQLTATKLEELRSKISSHKPLIVAICEVKSKGRKERKTIEYKIEGYNMYPVNIETSNRRSIIVYIKNEINGSIASIDVNFVEAVMLEVKLKGGDTLLFSCIYHSPTQNEQYVKNAENFNKLITSVDKNKRYTHRCFVGDFNYTEIKWVKWNTNNNENSTEEKFLHSL